MYTKNELYRAKPQNKAQVKRSEPDSSLPRKKSYSIKELYHPKYTVRRIYHNPEPALSKRKNTLPQHSTNAGNQDKSASKSNKPVKKSNSLFKRLAAGTLCALTLSLGALGLNKAHKSALNNIKQYVTLQEPVIEEYHEEAISIDSTFYKAWGKPRIPDVPSGAKSYIGKERYDYLRSLKIKGDNTNGDNANRVNPFITVVHCLGMSNNNYNLENELRIIRDKYHFLIDQQGVIYALLDARFKSDGAGRSLLVADSTTLPSGIKPGILLNIDYLAYNISLQSCNPGEKAVNSLEKLLRFIQREHNTKIHVKHSSLAADFVWNNSYLRIKIIKLRKGNDKKMAIMYFRRFDVEGLNMNDITDNVQDEEVVRRNLEYAVMNNMADKKKVYRIVTGKKYSSDKAYELGLF